MKTLEPTTKVQTTTTTTTTTMMKRKRKQMTQDEHWKSDRKHQTHANRQGRPDDRLILILPATGIDLIRLHDLETDRS